MNTSATNATWPTAKPIRPGGSCSGGTGLGSALGSAIGVGGIDSFGSSDMRAPA